jgi:hypothetical protein
MRNKATMTKIKMRLQNKQGKAREEGLFVPGSLLFGRGTMLLFRFFGGESQQAPVT